MAKINHVNALVIMAGVAECAAATMCAGTMEFLLRLCGGLAIACGLFFKM